MKNIYCIRHGLALHNVLGQEIGSKAYFLEKCFDAPLVDKGILQAKELGKKWDNLDKIQKLIDAKKLDPEKLINHKTLLDLGLVKSKKARIKLLAKGEIKNKINIEVSAFSKSAKECIDKIGGSIVILDEKKTKIIEEKKTEV